MTPIHWTAGVSGKERGNALGYATSNRYLMEHVGKLHPLVDSESAKIHVSYCYPTPHMYKPREDKLNVLFTMCESPALDQVQISALNNPLTDVVFTPSEWCADIFRASCDKKVFVVPLGVSAEDYPAKIRSYNPKKERFRILYVGAPNYRKITVMFEIFQHFISRIPNVELYAKFTKANTDKDSVRRMIKSGLPVVGSTDDMIFGKGFTIDNRYLPKSELLNIYHESHCFLFLTGGEGFGMTPLEAMSTGLPCIVSDWSAVSEFCNDKNSWMVPSSLKHLPCTGPESKVVTQLVGWPEHKPAMEAIGSAITNEKLRLKKAKASAIEASKWPWLRSAEVFSKSIYDTLVNDHCPS